MVFQDFDLAAERKKAERRRWWVRRISAAAISIVLLAIFIAATLEWEIYKNRNIGDVETKTNTTQFNAHSNSNPKPKTSKDNQQINDKGDNKLTKLVKAMCKSTEYRERCESTLDKAVESNNSNKSVEPKDLLKAGIVAVKEEIKKALNKNMSFKFHTDKEKAAYEDCLQLTKDAREELQSSADQVENSNTDKEVSDKAAELNNWLSAVMSYQQTCVDGFEDGELKNDIKDAFGVSRELTSNSLALVSEFELVIVGEGGGNGRARHLLAVTDGEGLPGWVNVDQRRMMKEVKLTANVTVAKDGSGDFKTINEALDKMPKTYQGRYAIYVKEGTYKENVEISKEMVNVTIYGDGSRKSVISGSKSLADGVLTFRTATFAVMGDDFMGKSIGFRNTAGPEKQQAVAARVQSDRSVFVNCLFEGHEATLYAQTHRQFYRSCVVTGTTDFIFGDAAAIFQKCDIVLRKPSGWKASTVTAHGRSDKHETTGTVLQACHIQNDGSFGDKGRAVKSHLGRPWKDYARTVVMESTIDDVIEPEGWLGWKGEEHRNGTVYYAEYRNEGEGSKTEGRVRWQGYHEQLSRDEAASFTVGAFLQADWIAATGAPVNTGLFG